MQWLDRRPGRRGWGRSRVHEGEARPHFHGHLDDHQLADGNPVIRGWASGGQWRVRGPLQQRVHHHGGRGGQLLGGPRLPGPALLRLPGLGVALLHRQLCGHAGIGRRHPRLYSDPQGFLHHHGDLHHGDLHRDHGHHLRGGPPARQRRLQRRLQPRVQQPGPGEGGLSCRRRVHGLAVLLRLPDLGVVLRHARRPRHGR
mmetsp:Transcript_110256/g.312792  ORF Transcript_110256/g.312792 Transcript_110256/m.312792 type:complete len:200 (+) Transcript_110256:536-1135(+)